MRRDKKGARMTGTLCIRSQHVDFLFVLVQAGHNVPDLHLLSETAELHGQSATSPASTVQNGRHSTAVKSAECSPGKLQFSFLNQSRSLPAYHTDLLLPANALQFFSHRMAFLWNAKLPINKLGTNSKIMRRRRRMIQFPLFGETEENEKLAASGGA